MATYNPASNGVNTLTATALTATALNTTLNVSSASALPYFQIQSNNLQPNNLQQTFSQTYPMGGLASALYTPPSIVLDGELIPDELIEKLKLEPTNIGILFRGANGKTYSLMSTLVKMMAFIKEQTEDREKPELYKYMKRHLQKSKINVV